MTVDCDIGNNFECALFFKMPIKRTRRGTDDFKEASEYSTLLDIIVEYMGCEIGKIEVFEQRYMLVLKIPLNGKAFTGNDDGNQESNVSQDPQGVLYTRDKSKGILPLNDNLDVNNVMWLELDDGMLDYLPSEDNNNNLMCSKITITSDEQPNPYLMSAESHKLLNSIHSDFGDDDHNTQLLRAAQKCILRLAMKFGTSNFRRYYNVLHEIASGGNGTYDKTDSDFVVMVNNFNHIWNNIGDIENEKLNKAINIVIENLDNEDLVYKDVLLMALHLKELTHLEALNAKNLKELDAKNISFGYSADLKRYLRYIDYLYQYSTGFRRVSMHRYDFNYGPFLKYKDIEPITFNDAISKLAQEEESRDQFILNLMRESYKTSNLEEEEEEEEEGYKTPRIAGDYVIMRELKSPSQNETEYWMSFWYENIQNDSYTLYPGLKVMRFLYHTILTGTFIVETLHQMEEYIQRDINGVVDHNVNRHAETGLVFSANLPVDQTKQSVLGGFTKSVALHDIVNALKGDEGKLALFFTIESLSANEPGGSTADEKASRDLWLKRRDESKATLALCESFLPKQYQYNWGASGTTNDNPIINEDGQKGQEQRGQTAGGGQVTGMRSAEELRQPKRAQATQLVVFVLALASMACMGGGYYC
jgi:hypothetical protein